LRTIELQDAFIRHHAEAAVGGDIVGQGRIAAHEGQVPIADRDRALGPLAEGCAHAASDGDTRLIVDLDIADDLAPVGYGSDRAAAGDRVARAA
jgi:hypothetical protein